MIYIETDSTDAAYNFACEEYCMKRFKGHHVLIIWQADKCIMLGRYQAAQSEININAVKKFGAYVIRRNTGGGTIYTDLGNLLYTNILPVNDLTSIDFSTVCRPIVDALRKIGVNAELKGRNDILIGEKKISGNAQTIHGNILCSHGSLLYDADLDAHQDLLTVDISKIKSKGISSVRSRVTNIIDNIPVRYTTYEFWQKLKEILFEGEEVNIYKFTDEEIENIKIIRNEKYAAWEWNFGRAPKYNYQNEIRFPMGKVSVNIDINNGIIEKCKINGDFLGLMPIEPLEELIMGTPYIYDAVKKKTENADFNLYFRGISQKEFLKCIFS